MIRPLTHLSKVLKSTPAAAPIRRTHPPRVIAAILTVVAGFVGCDSPAVPPRTAHAIVVFNAGALARPLREALDSFARAATVDVSQESAGSLETVRKITELGKSPDVVALADTALFSRFLSGGLDGPVTPIGRTRMVLAYTARSRDAERVDSTSWVDIVLRPDVEVGRSEPSLDPAGYRALMVFQLAEKHYRRPGLAHLLELGAPARNIRPKSADLVALLQTGNLDYAWEYESVARANHLRFVRLPADIDLGEGELAGRYAESQVVIRAPGKRGHPDSLVTVMRGAPIVFGIAAFRAPPNDGVGRRFITYLLSNHGRRIFAAHGLEPVDAIPSADTR